MNDSRNILAEPSAGLAAVSTREEGRRWVALALLSMPVICATLLTKFAIPPFGAQGIGIAVMVLPVVIAAGIFAGCMRIDPVRLALFLVITGGLGIVPLLRGDSFSLNSVALFVALHVPFVFAVAAGRDSARWAIRFFLNVSLLLAALAIAQYFLQFVVDIRYLFPIENFVPDSFVVQHFNKQAPLGFSGLFRANGVFLLEPSYLAQLLAMAIVIELCTLNRLRWLPVYGLGLIVAHAGTGFVILAAVLPVFVISRKRIDLLVAGVCGLIVLYLFQDYLMLDRMLARVEEFGSPESSGFSRFIGGFYVLDEFLWKDPWSTLFGAGAGSFQDFAIRSDYAAAEMPLFKTLFEFGLLGTVAYFGFLMYCLFSSPLPPLIGYTILVCLLLNGLYIPFAHVIALSLLVWPFSMGERLPFAEAPVAPPENVQGYRLRTAPFRPMEGSVS